MWPPSVNRKDLKRQKKGGGAIFLLLLCFQLGSLCYSLTLKKTPVPSSETVVNLQQTIQDHIINHSNSFKVTVMRTSHLNIYHSGREDFKSPQVLCGWKLGFTLFVMVFEFKKCNTWLSGHIHVQQLSAFLDPAILSTAHNRFCLFHLDRDCRVCMRHSKAFATVSP